MDYDKGTILTKRDIVFKQTNKFDFRIAGHPILLPIYFGFEDDHLYFLTLSSKVEHYVQDPDRYFKLKVKDCPGLKKPSIIDLKYIYKCERYNSIPMTYVPDYINNQIIDKFMNYEQVIQDEDYDEFIQMIS